MTLGSNYNCNTDITVGTIVRALRRVSFCDGTFHQLNDEIEVTQETLAYFQLFTDGKTYEVMK